MSRGELVARAEHELRGAATALSLACEVLRRDPTARHHAAVIDAQLDRLLARPPGDRSPAGAAVAQGQL